RFPIDGDDAGRCSRHRCDPSSEALLELPGVERGKNIAQMIVRGRPVTKRPEPAQEFEFHLTEQRDVDKGFRSRENREQTQQQDFVQRIKHLAALARIRKLLEMIQKNNGFGFCPKFLRSSIAILRGSNQRTTTDSAFYRL